jgi:IclR family transcriptional regulator, pca regulon regulatory protein
MPDNELVAGHSQSLERGLGILLAFTEARPVLGIADLARSLDLNKSTTHRYVATLTSLGFLQQDPDTRKYRLGTRVIELGFAAVNSMEVARVAGRALQALSDETGYTVSMAVLDGTEIVYVDRCRSAREGRFGIDLNLHVGSRLPAYCTSMGKALLAYQPPDRLKELVERTDLARRGPNTLTAREALLTSLTQVRLTGIAVNDEELAPGLRSIAAPIRDGRGAVVAAANIVVHLSMWNAPIESMAAKFEAPLRRTVDDISARMGYRVQPVHA